MAKVREVSHCSLLLLSYYCSIPVEPALIKKLYSTLQFKDTELSQIPITALLLQLSQLFDETWTSFQL